MYVKGRLEDHETIAALLAGRDPAATAEAAAIAAVAELSAESGQLRGVETRILKNLLSLNALTAADIMTPRTVIVAFPQTMTVGELVDQQATGRESPGRAYMVEDLPVIRAMAMSAGHAAVLVLALYISSDDVQRLYSEPAYLWLICPLLLYWSTRMLMKTHRGVMTDDPIVFAVTDKVSLALGVASAAIVLAAAF